MQTGQEAIIAELPSNIKKITHLPGGNLIYINKTNERDHGEEVSLYTYSTKNSAILFKAESGFGIDDYVISPNKRYISTWEVKFASGSAILQGGNSRVLSVDLQNPATKNLIYDEVSDKDTPIHYPRAITDTGDIYLDTFLPNSGAGWAYGMSKSSFTGTAKENLAGMQNGTYGTQPALSPDGTTLAFAGYDQNDGAKVEYGFRKALISPSKIELFDTQTRKKVGLANLPNTDIYSYVAWDETGNNLIFTRLSKDIQTMGFYIYNLADNTYKKLQLVTSQIGLASLEKDKVLIATQDSSPGTLGNLGKSYSHSITSFLVLETSSGKTTPLNLSDSLVQFITIIPSSNKVLGENTFKKTLQIIVLPLRERLGPQRSCQQAEPPESCNPTPTPTPPAPTIPYGTPPTGIPPPTPRPTSTPHPTPTPRPVLPNCISIAFPRCISNPQAISACSYYINNGIHPIPPLSSCGGAVGDTNTLNSCLNFQESVEYHAGTCYGTPLYLYGPSGLNVKVNAETANQTFNVTLPTNPISYSYTPGIKRIIPPSEGIITSKANLSSTLEFFAANLGLNEKETEGLVDYGKTVQSPFVFVSYFDSETSKKILPLKFEPEPDTYINIVFYFKPLSTLPPNPPNPPNPPTPTFRKGFTAVEISEFLDE